MLINERDSISWNFSSVSVAFSVLLINRIASFLELDVWKENPLFSIPFDLTTATGEVHLHFLGSLFKFL